MRSDPYHHGDLPAALRGAAADLLAERGVARFSLREVARRAGVSHAAPAHHFGDATGLLTSVAIEAFTYLRARMEAVVVGVEDPVDGLAALGRAYVSVAVEHPGHCAVIFRKDAVDADDPAYRRAGEAAFAVLVDGVQRLADQRAPDLDVLLAANLCWSSMQGLVGLHETMTELSAGRGVEIAPIGDLADAFSRQLVVGLLPR